MDLNCFRDRLFDLLNDSEGMGIADMNADEQNSLIAVRTDPGTGILCHFRGKYRNPHKIKYNN